MGAAWVALNGVAALHVFLGAFFYGVVYTLWLKRRTSSTSSLAVLREFCRAGGCRRRGSSPGARCPGCWPWCFLVDTAPFWSLAIANRDDYAQAGVPMLPVVGPERAARTVFGEHRGAVCGLTASLAYGAGPGVCRWRPGWWAALCAQILVARAQARCATAMGSFFASLVQLSVLLVAACIDAMLR